MHVSIMVFYILLSIINQVDQYLLLRAYLNAQLLYKCVDMQL